MYQLLVIRLYLFTRYIYKNFPINVVCFLKSRHRRSFQFTCDPKGYLKVNINFSMIVKAGTLAILQYSTNYISVFFRVWCDTITEPWFTSRQNLLLFWKKISAASSKCIQFNHRLLVGIGHKIHGCDFIRGQYNKCSSNNLNVVKSGDSAGNFY